MQLLALLVSIDSNYYLTGCGTMASSLAPPLLHKPALVRLVEDVCSLPELRPLAKSAAAAAWMVPELGLPCNVFDAQSRVRASSVPSASSRALMLPSPAVAAVSAAAADPHPPIPPPALRTAVAHDVVVRRDRPHVSSSDDDGGGRLGPLVAACSVLTVPLHHVAAADDDSGEDGGDGSGGVVCGVILNDVAVDRVASSFGSPFVAAPAGRFCYFPRTGQFMTASRCPDGRTIASLVCPHGGGGEVPGLANGTGAAAPAAELEWLKVGWSPPPPPLPLASTAGSAAVAAASATALPPEKVVFGGHLSLLHHRVTPPAAASHLALGSSPVAPWASAMDALVGTFGSAIMSVFPMMAGAVDGGGGNGDGGVAPQDAAAHAVIPLVTTIQRSGDVAIARLCCRAVASGRGGGVPHPAALRLPPAARLVVRRPPPLLRPARLPILRPAPSGSSNGGVGGGGRGGDGERTGGTPGAVEGTPSSTAAAVAPLRRHRIDVDALPTAAARARAVRNRASAARSNARRKRARLASAPPDGGPAGGAGAPAAAAVCGESGDGGGGAVRDGEGRGQEGAP